MRYYSIRIAPQATGPSIVQNPSGGFMAGSGPTFSSLAQLPMTGQTVVDPGALDIGFDIPVTQLAVPKGGFRIKISGPGLQMLGQASQLAGMHFSMSAGMYRGLPLATQQTPQAGVIAVGTILASYGNWQGTNQTLDLLVNPGSPQNLFGTPVSFQWLAGTPLSDAIDAALSAAFPGFKIQVYILDENFTLPNDEAGFYKNLSQFASYLDGLTKTIGSQTHQDYSGVQIAYDGSTITVYDGTVTNAGPAKSPVLLEFQDIVGQPTWIAATKVQFNTVLRADVGVGNAVKFPSEILAPYALTSPTAAAPGNVTPVNNKIAFQGTFLVNDVEHFGQFRDPDADSWVTAFTATASLAS
ncbi:MAG: hypothetical protein WBW93_14410 [Steroidobacteraceae bacterium]